MKYNKIFADSDTYQTKIKKKSVFSEFIFYLKLIRIVLVSGIRANKGKYDKHGWVKDSIEILENLEKAGKV